MNPHLAFKPNIRLNAYGSITSRKIYALKTIILKKKKHYLQPWILKRPPPIGNERTLRSVSPISYSVVIFRHNVDIGKSADRRADLGCIIRERTSPATVSQRVPEKQR